MIEKIFWNLQYVFGQARWDTGITPPELVQLVESGEVTPGRALDIGCGTGTNVLYLAEHGFEAVGIDVARLAIRRARKKARQAGVEAAFYTTEVLRLGRPDGPALGDQFNLAIDIGCLHGLPSSDRPAYAAMLRRVLRFGGLYLLYAWGPRKILGRDVGLTPDEAQTSLANDFHARWIRRGEERGDPSNWYLFERCRPSGAAMRRGPSSAR